MDIVERLDDQRSKLMTPILGEAAREIRRLREVVGKDAEKLEAANRLIEAVQQMADADEENEGEIPLRIIEKVYAALHATRVIAQN